jgi:hypothetical protein
MINEGVVSLAQRYLDLRFAENREGTLVEMVWYIDARDKMIPLLDEVNEALRRHASAYVQRADVKIIFTRAGSDRTITDEDLERAIINYREEFAATLKRLESEKSEN